MINQFALMPVHSLISLHLREQNKSSLVVFCDLKSVVKVLYSVLIFYNDVLKIRKGTTYLDTCTVVNYISIKNLLCTEEPP